MSLDLSLKNLEFKFKVTGPQENRVFEFENFRLDATTKLLYRDGEQVVLTPKAVETLIALVESEGKVVAKDDLMQRIWADTIVEESNLAQYLHVLRRTLGLTSDGKPYIETLKRRGYRFNGVVSVVRNADSSVQSDHRVQEPNDTSVKTSTATPLRAERRVNVRSVTNIASEQEPVPAPAPALNVERSENIYTVADWRRDSPTPTTLPAVANSGWSWMSGLIVAVVLAGVVGIGFGVYRLSTPAQRDESIGMPFGGSDIARLTTDGRSKRVAITPDGKYIAHVSSSPDGDRLLVRQVAVANDTLVAGPMQSDLVWITFAPDGNYIYYLTLERDVGETELFRVPLLGGPTVKVANDIGAPSISPDGQKFAFMRMNQETSELVVSNIDGTNEAVIVSRRDPDYLNMFWYAPAWSLDGKSIAFPVNQSDENGRYETLLAVDVETRVERKLTNERWQQVGQARWLPDGLVVTASDTSTGPNQLWNISLNDGSASRITRDLNSYRHLSLTSDASALAVIQNHVVSNIWTRDASGTAKQLRSEAGWLNELIWLPDGRLAYTSNAGGSSDIWTMNADGSGVRQLTVGANARLGLALTANKDQFVFAAEKDGKYNLWRVDVDGSDLTRITDGDGEFYPQCTPDGRWIVYQSGGNYPTLWRMPAGGGGGERAANDNDRFASIPLTRRKIRRVPLS